MIGESHSHIEVQPGYTKRRFLIALAPVAFAVAASLAVPDWLFVSQATAAEVDAVGAAAPTGFADIVGRVKSAVVGVRVKIEEATPSSEAQQDNPLAPGSPLERFFRQFGIPIPDSPAPKSGTALGSGFFTSGDG